LTAPVALGRQHLAPYVASFLKTYPDIQIELELTDRFINLAQEGFDLAIRHTHAAPDTHVAWALCETRSVLLASSDYLARRGHPSHPSQLIAHDCLLYLGSHASTWTFVRHAKRKPAANAERVGVAIKGLLKANNSEVLREALQAGLGIGLLPDFSISSGTPGQTPLVQVLPDWQVQGFFADRIYALRPWSAQVPRAVQCLVAHLRQSFAAGFATGA
jgi:DNA-binding transcriptional LysR family regulator